MRAAHDTLERSIPPSADQQRRGGDASGRAASGTDAARPFSRSVHLGADAEALVRRRLGSILHEMAQEFALLLDLIEPCADAIPVGQLLAPVEEFERLCRYARRHIAPNCNVDGVPPVVLGPGGISELFRSPEPRDSSRTPADG